MEWGCLCPRCVIGWYLLAYSALPSQLPERAPDTSVVGLGAPLACCLGHLTGQGRRDGAGTQYSRCPSYESCGRVRSGGVRVPSGTIADSTLLLVQRKNK